MLTEQNTIYPAIHTSIDEQIEKIFAPSKDEILFAETNTANKKYQLLLLTLLRSYQIYRRFIPLIDLPFDIIHYIANVINFEEIKLGVHLVEYDRSRQKLRHVALIKDHLGIKTSCTKTMATIALEFAKNRENIETVFNCTVESMIFENMELPSFGSLKTIVELSRRRANNFFYKKIYSSLSPKQIDHLDKCLFNNFKSYEKQRSWKDIKTDPPTVSANNVKHYTEHVQWLQSLVINKKIFNEIPLERYNQLYVEGISLNLYKLNRLPKMKRYALVSTVIQKATEMAVDNLTTMIIKTYNIMKSSAKNKLLAYKTSRLNVVDDLVYNFECVLECYNKPTTKTKRIDAIDEIVSDQHEDLLAKCSEYNAYKINDPFPIMLDIYKSKRALLWGAIRNLKILSSSRDKSIQNAIEFIVGLPMDNQEFIKLSENMNWKLLPLDYMPEKAKKIVKPKRNIVNRKAYELCLIAKIIDEIRSKDLYVLHSSEYHTHKQNLISLEQFNGTANNYCKLVGIPRKDDEFVDFVKGVMETKTNAADEAFNNENIGAKIEKGKIILKKVTATVKPNNFEELDNIITSRMTNVGILNVIASVTESLQLQRFLRPASGHDSKHEDINALLASTIFCYGCNLGVNEASRSLKNISRKQLGRINNYYVTEANLKQCITEVVNCYNRYQLPKFWGTGEHVSVDGTKWDMYKKNLLSEYHIRYGGFGGIGYYHISDTYIALFSNLISCGSYEALHIIGEMLKNRSDIKPTCVHGDTHAQSYPIFAVAYLLGIKIMPRIRGIKDLNFYKASKDATYSNLSPILTQKINWKLIQTHYDDMLRIVISIKECKTDIKAMMTKICTKSKKNKLYFAFRELGRAIRTCYLLEYITDYNLRKLVNAATCKSEEFNAFLDWVAFARDQISSNSPTEQRKFIKYNHLVANMVILYNVNEMSMIIKDLISEDVKVDYEMLKYFSPYRNQHISRLGYYELATDADLGKMHILNPSIDIFSKN